MGWLNNMWSKVKTLLNVLLLNLADIWNRGKMYLLGILAIIVTLEFRKLKEYLLLRAGQNEMKADKKEDQALAVQEKNDNDQANALIKKAGQEGSDNKPVDDNWNKS